MKNDFFKKLEEKIQINFNNIEILKKSLVHKSFDSKDNNEKLEFLGDRVLGLILCKELIKIYPSEKEGIIDKKLANLVKRKTCAKIGEKLNIKSYMILGDSYKNQKKSNEKITSDALEALIGAIFLDKGLQESEKFILFHWKNFLDKSDFTHVDSKTKLQEYTLKRFKELPEYKTFKQTGPRHDPTFKVEVKIYDSKKYSATGRSKKEAQQNAAKKLIEDLKI